MRLLIVEDNSDLASLVGEHFESLGHVTDFAGNGLTGLHLASTQDYDAIVLDVMLPGMDGISLCRKLRQEAGKHTPILILSARDGLDDKLTGFAAGGDDYLAKPFSVLELEARLKALTRRPNALDDQQSLAVGDLEFDLKCLRIARSGKDISLTPVARKMLALLMRESPRVVKRAEIEREVWGDHPPDGDALRVHICAVRSGIDKDFPQKLLHTVHGVGYRLAADKH